MSYGNGKDSDDYDYRAIPMAVGALTASKRGSLSFLRDAHLVVLTEFGKLAFTQEPLLGVPTKQSISEKLLSAQKELKGYNKAYAEKARISVTTAASEQNKRYFAQLFGRLAHCGDEIPTTDRKLGADGSVARKYYYVPVSVQDHVTKKELAALQAFTAPVPEGTPKPSPAAYVALFQCVILKNDTAGLTANQVAVVREIHSQVQARHRELQFGAETTTVQIPLDYRMLLSEDAQFPARLDARAQALVVADKTNARYKFFLALSNPVPGDARIAIPLVLRKDQLERLCIESKRGKKLKEFTASSLTLELGPRGFVAVKLVLTQPKQTPKPLTEYKYLLARDFGYVNTVSLSVIKLDEALDIKRLEQIQDFTKEEAKKFLTQHAATSQSKVVLRQRMNGRKFLGRLQHWCLKIDGYQSRISNEYTSLEAQKELLAIELGLVKDKCGECPWLELAMAPKGHPLYGALQKFFRTLHLIHDLKVARTRAYAKVASVKKAWFGYVANRELALAREYDALVVAEDLTVTAIEKEAPAYKGRAFNKMINHGAHGQYRRAATNKFLWNGVPEVALPSYYTSLTCVRHGHVDKAMRNGEVFACPHCVREGRPKEHADEHAADTLGLYLTLRPKLNVKNALP